MPLCRSTIAHRSISSGLLWDTLGPNPNAPRPAIDTREAASSKTKLGRKPPVGSALAPRAPKPGRGRAISSCCSACLQPVRRPTDGPVYCTAHHHARIWSKGDWLAGIRSIDRMNRSEPLSSVRLLSRRITRIISQLWGAGAADAACCCCCLAMLLMPFLWLVARPLGGFSPLARSNPTAGLRAAGQSIDGTPGPRPQATASAQRPHTACGVRALLGGWRSGVINARSHGPARQPGTNERGAELDHACVDGPHTGH